MKSTEFTNICHAHVNMLRASGVACSGHGRDAKLVLPGSLRCFTDHENRVVLFTLSGAYLVQSTKPFRHRRTSLVPSVGAHLAKSGSLSFVNDV